MDEESTFPQCDLILTLLITSAMALCPDKVTFWESRKDRNLGRETLFNPVHPHPPLTLESMELNP